MASKDLRTRVLIDTKSAERNLNNLFRKINAVDRAMKKVGSGGNQLSAQLQRSTRQAQQLRNAMNGVTGATRQAANASRQHGNAVGLLTQKVRRLASAYMGIMGLKLALDTSDQVTSASNRLNYMNAQQLGNKGVNKDGGYSTKTLSMTQEQMDKMYNSANKVRTEYGAMMGNVSKSMLLAGKAFNNNIDNAIRFQEVMAEAYTISGASQAEQNSSMYQMMQALGSGTLQGDELRSVREGAQMAYQAIEQFAQGVYHSDESLKDMASQGKITSDIVVAAILNAGDQMDAAFSRSSMTFAQAWTLIKNSAVKAFEQVGLAMSQALNGEQFAKLAMGISDFLQAIGNFASMVVSVLGSLFGWIIDNWYWIRYIVFAVLAAIAAHFVVVGATAMATALASFAAWMMALSPVLLVILAIGAVLAGLAAVAGDTVSIGELIVTVIGVILGAIFTAISFVLNLGQAVFNALATFITILVALIVNAGIKVVNAVATIANVVSKTGKIIKDVFAAAFSYAAARGWAFANSVASAILKVANYINNILGVFGIQINTSGLEGLVSKTAGKMAENMVSGNTSMGDAKELLSDAFKSAEGKLDYININNAVAKAGSITGTAFEKGWASNSFNAGKDLVSSAGSWIGNKLSSLTNLTNTTGNNALKVDDFSNLLNGNNPLGNGGGSGGSGGSGGLGSKGDDVTDALDTLVDNSDKMLDTMNLSEDDLKKLYELAELEWKKDFTTNHINVNMTNNNNISNESDVEGLFTKLADKFVDVLYQEANTNAAGVYS